MADTTEIFANNARAWTGVTQVQQAASEALQNDRAAVQATYDAAQGNNGAQRDSATLATIEAAAAARQNTQPALATDITPAP